MSSDDLNIEESISPGATEPVVRSVGFSPPALSSASTSETRLSASAPKPRLWTVFLTVLFATIFYMGVSLVCFVIAITVVAAMSDADPTKKSTSELMNNVLSHPGSILFLLVPGHIVLLGIAIAAAVFSPSPFATRLSLRLPAWPWWTTIAAVLAAPFFSFLWSIVLSQFVSSNEYFEKMAEMFRSTTNGFGFAVTLLCISVMPAFSEEWLFRGYVQTRLLQRWSPWLAILVSSSLFAAFHLDPLHVIAVFPIGLWLGYISWRCASIIPAMLAHAYNNALSLVGVIYDEADAMDSGMSSIANQATVFLGLPALLVFIGYLIAARLRPRTIATG